MFGKSHFEDEERLRGWRENSETERIRGKDLGQILGANTWDKYILGSLTLQTKRDFRENTCLGILTSRTKRDFGEQRETSECSIL